ncbi:MFS general substrate transporter [Hypoxylon trugodes]|uniref:MFS general substrate transporter n=1 Tax=Hypoxylon trugodes TaxID=326681 RepID=UPI002195F944|nr:MFS general substrate transporter [Hypoxylon trugodes]KAI1383877.1 MFS general substrate transporter [Hypoxylon trugodes]
MAPREVQLQNLANSSSPVVQTSTLENAPPTENNDRITTSQTLPQTDRGRAAYLVLAGCVLIQTPIWGYSLAFGIFQEYYTSSRGASILSGDRSAGTIASIGNSQTGILYLMMPATFILLTKYPSLRRFCMPFGLLLTTACLAASSFATTASQLIAVQGVLHAVGCGLLFAPASLCLDEWFPERKGLAYGAMWSGKSVSGAGMPFLANALLSRYGGRTTLRIFCVASAILTIPPLLLMRERPATRSPVSTATASEDGDAREIDGGREVRDGRLSFAFARHTTFWILQCGNVFQSLGYLMPSTYIASYAAALGFPSATRPILLALISLASVFGSLMIGLLSDAGLRANTVILVSSLGSALPVFLLWGLGGGAHQVAILIVFTILYGFFAGGFSSTWPGILREMKRRDRAVDTGLIFGMLLGGRGIGFVVSGPVGGALLQANRFKAEDFTGFATQYGPMIVYTGLTTTLGAWSWFWTMGERAIKAL